MSIVVMGVSHKTASIEVRERIAIPASDRAEAYAALFAFTGIREAVILSTCNRVEVYVNATTDRAGTDALESFFAQRTGAALNERNYFCERGMDAVEHAFRVVCSLDSQLLGEAQILGQMRGAFEEASSCGACGEVLTQLFKSALHLGKRARTETAIGQDSVSLSTTAFKVASNTFPDLAQRRVLVLGAGEMAHLAATYLREAGVVDLLVCSRTPEHTQSFARDCAGQAIDFGDRYRAISTCDVVFSMTGAPHVVVEAASLEAARAESSATSRHLLIIDEAVPRDVDPACAELPGVELFNLESLTSIIDRGMEQRMAAVGAVERMVDEACDEFFAWMQQRLVTPTIRDIHAKGDAVVEGEVARAAKALGHLLGRAPTEKELQVLQAMGSSVAKKILHGPTARLRKEAETPDSYYYTGAARYLFGLDTFPVGSGLHHGDCPAGAVAGPRGHECVGVARCPAGGCSAGRALQQQEKEALAHA